MRLVPIADPTTAVAEARPACNAEPVMSCTARVETVTAAMNPVTYRNRRQKRERRSGADGDPRTDPIEPSIGA